MPEKFENRESQTEENQLVEKVEIIEPEIKTENGDKVLETLVKEDEVTTARELPRIQQELENAFAQTTGEKSEKKKERKSSVTRVVGKIDETQRDEMIENQKRIFEDQSAFRENQTEESNSLAHTNERKKTPEELEVIAVANDATNKVLETHGLEKFDIPPENVHILHKNLALKLWESLLGRKLEGSFGQFTESIEIKDPISKIALLHHVVHEMIHAKSYNARQRTKDNDPGLYNYRAGIETWSRDAEEIYFQGLNEAVTEELTKRIMEEAIEDPIFRKEKAKTEWLKKGIIGSLLPGPDDAFTEFKKEDTYYKGFTGSEKFGYKPNRQNLEELTNRIFLENKDRFKNKDEVFDVFVKATMTGNILDIGRLIEKSLGKGGFRSVGKGRARIK